jgi:hypothetical protein
MDRSTLMQFLTLALVRVTTGCTESQHRTAGRRTAAGAVLGAIA